MNLRQVSVEVTYRCNFRCTYCPQGDVRAKPATADILGTLDRLRAEGYGVVVFNGGEPTLCPELASWIAHARAIGFAQRTIVTNATMLGSPDYVRSLIEAGLTHVNVSFHTCREQVFDALAAVPGGYQRALNGLRTLLSVNAELGKPLFIHANLLLMRPTLADAPSTVGFLADLGVPMVTLEVVRARGPRAQAVQCQLSEVLTALGAAMSVARQRGLGLNTADVPACCFASLADVDIASYLVRREKQVHWVVARGSEGALNRDSHLKSSSCRGCAVGPWCSGFERCLVQAEGNVAIALDGGAPLPAALDPCTILHEAAARLAATGPSATERARALDRLSLLSPPSASTVTQWLRLYEAYAVGLEAFDSHDSHQAAEALGLFPPQGGRAQAERARSQLELLAAREQRIEERLQELSRSMSVAPAEVPDCCRAAALARGDRAARSRLFWLHAVLRAERCSLLNTAPLPEVAPFVTCQPGCAAACAVATERLARLAPAARAAADRLLETPCLALGPWVRVWFGGAVVGDRALGYDPSALVVLTEPSLGRALRNKLLQAVAERVLPALLEGNTLEEHDDSLVICRDGQEVARFAWRIRWARALLRPAAAAPAA